MTTIAIGGVGRDVPRSEPDRPELRNVRVALRGGTACPHCKDDWAPHFRKGQPECCNECGKLPISNAAEAFETLCARGVLPDSWAGDVRRAFVHKDRPDDGWGDELDVLTPHPHTIPALVSWASLGRKVIQQAEETARHGADMMTIRPPVVVWRVVRTTPAPSGVLLWQYERQRKLCGEGVLAPCDALALMGIMWVYANDREIMLAIPPIGDK